jgi:methionine-gamma-lyase
MKHKFETECIHAGFEPEQHKAHITPIYASSTYLFDSVEYAADLFLGKEQGYIYGRWGNPTITQTENKLAQLEAYNILDNNGKNIELKAILHASGLGAFNTLFMGLLQQGDTILSHYSLYGGTQEIVDKILPKAGINVLFDKLDNLTTIEDLLIQNSSIKLIHLETPANPTLSCVDILGITTLAHKHNVYVSVDNTFATPFLQRPFEYGVDFVLHSTTKFLNGHGTGISGVLISRHLQLMNTTFIKQHRLMGANSNAFDAFLLNTGLKTFALRMQQHCTNAEKVAAFLNNHPAIEHVNYLGLPNHPHYAIAQKQMKHAGALLSFELKGGLKAGAKFINTLKLCTHATSLGTCDTLISHPASTTHVGVKPEHRLASGITDGLIRMSVGLENADDIINDLSQALEERSH